MDTGPEISAPASDGSIAVEGVRLTHPDRVLYPEQGITKVMLARYYVAISDWIIPEVRNRPLSLVRCPDGEGKACFYQKHVGIGIPDSIGRVEIAEKSGKRTYPVIENLAGLIATVQIGVLELHPWGSTVPKLETPDRITFDLDPDIGLPWQLVTEAAIEMREMLLGIGLRSFAKTTGGKGLHVVVPIAPKLASDSTGIRSGNFRNGSRSGSSPPIPTASPRTWQNGRAPGASLSTICATAAARPRSPPIRRGRGRAPRSRRRCPGRRSRTASNRTASLSRPCRSGWPDSVPIPGPRCTRCASR